MSAIKRLVIFVLIFAIFSIVLIQNGETRYYTSLSEAYDIILKEWDFDFYRVKDSTDRLSATMLELQKTAELAFGTSYSLSPYPSLGGSVGGDGFAGGSAADMDVNEENFFDWCERIADLLVNFIKFLFAGLPLLFELLFELIYFLVAFFMDGVSFATSCFSVFWSLLFPAELSAGVS